jgi:hypothetical protein
MNNKISWLKTSEEDKLDLVLLLLNTGKLGEKKEKTLALNWENPPYANTADPCFHRRGASESAGGNDREDYRQPGRCRRLLKPAARMAISPAQACDAPLVPSVCSATQAFAILHYLFI